MNREPDVGILGFFCNRKTIAVVVCSFPILGHTGALGHFFRCADIRIAVRIGIVAATSILPRGTTESINLLATSLERIGIFQEGDEIIVPANTYIASILAISNNNLIPVLAEPDPISYNIDPLNIEKLISSKTKAIMPVHLYGQMQIF